MRMLLRPEPYRADEEYLQDTVDGEFADHGWPSAPRSSLRGFEHSASFGRGIGACCRRVPEQNAAVRIMRTPMMAKTPASP